MRTAITGGGSEKELGNCEKRTVQSQKTTEKKAKVSELNGRGRTEDRKLTSACASPRERVNILWGRNWCRVTTETASQGGGNPRAVFPRGIPRKK